MSITISAESAAAEQVIRIALAATQSSSTGEVEGVHLTITGQEGAWLFIDHTNGVKRKPGTSGDLIYHLTDRLVHHIAAGSTTHHCLHAAAVSHQGRALIMPAGTGSGKSLLTAWLVSNGFDYMSDELTVVDDEFGVDGIARPIQIKRGGLSALNQLIDSQESIIPGGRSNSVPVSQLTSQPGSHFGHSLGLVVFPEFRPDAGYSLSRLALAEAGMKLIPNHINARNLPGHGFRSLMELVRNTPCFGLNYGGFTDLPTDFASTLRGLLESSQAG